MTNYIHTGKYFYMPQDIIDHGTTPEEEKWELIYVDSEENLCDAHMDGECVGNRYYTDSKWFDVHHCRFHMTNHIAEGIFEEIK